MVVVDPDVPRLGVRTGEVNSEEERVAKQIANNSWTTSIQKSFEDRGKRPAAGAEDPHALDFAGKKEAFEELAKSMGAPTRLQEAQLRQRADQDHGQRTGIGIYVDAFTGAGRASLCGDGV